MALYHGLFWTYERGTWQYDLMVALILAFIFFTPRAWFHDQPASPVTGAAAGLVDGSVAGEVQPVQNVHPIQPVQDFQPDEDVQLVSSTPTENVYRLRATLIDPDSGRSIRQEAERILEVATGNPVHVIRIEAETDAQDHVASYRAWIEH